MRTRVFTVDINTWSEHRQAGVAGINDPVFSSNTAQSLATRQKVLSEVAGIRPGDRIFFYIQREKHVVGVYQAISQPFFDQSPVFPSAAHVNARFPFRVAFAPVIEYPRPVHVNEIWAGRDAGQIWTMQQARGDAVGRHACWCLSKSEGDLLDRMLQELNIVPLALQPPAPPPSNRPALPIDYRMIGTRNPCLRYEATVQSLILEGLADGEWRDLFGEYDDFMQFVPTSEGTEIDVVLLRHDSFGKVIWYQILELKKDRYQYDHLLQLLSYETWLTSSQAEGNPRSVHMAAIANRFDQDVRDQVEERRRLMQKPVRLIEYDFDSTTNKLQLTQIA